MARPASPAALAPFKRYDRVSSAPPPKVGKVIESTHEAKLPTIRDVADRANVSVGTVSNFINGNKRVSVEAEARIAEAIDELSWIPNRAVRSLHGATPVIGFVVPDAANPFFTELGRHVEAAAHERGCVLVFCDTAGSAERELAYLRNLAEMRVSGVILTSVGDGARKLKDLQTVQVPIVLLGQPERNLNVPSVTVDQFASGRIASQHLLSVGRRKVMFVGERPGGRILDARYEGAKRALEELELDSATIRRTVVSNRSTREVERVVDSLIETGSDAVYCANDAMALLVLNALIRRGVRVPDDVAVIGNDGIEAAEQAAIPLSTVQQPIGALGSSAADLLFDSKVNGQSMHLVLQSHLVARESTTVGRPPLG